MYTYIYMKNMYVGLTQALPHSIGMCGVGLRYWVNPLLESPRRE